MLSLIISWIIILFVTLVWGDMLVSFYNKLCKQKEEYNLFEKIILGLFAITVPLTYWSMMLPSNHYFLAILVLIAIGYTIVRRDKMSGILAEYTTKIKNISPLQMGGIILFIFVVLISNTWVEGAWDSIFYHYQNIRWNEEYAVVPGLGNIDDKMAFNSNFLLLSAIFSFTFMWGEPTYPLQSLVVVAFACWMFYNLFSSKYEIKRVLILVAFSLFYLASMKALLDTSTDIFPNLIIFYLIAKTILSPDFIKNNKLFAITIPILVITCKLSLAPFALVSLYATYLALKQKEYSVLYLAFGLSTLLSIGWFARNVIVSGYMMYPFYQLDLFDVDWKIPLQIAINQTANIKDTAFYYFELLLNKPLDRDREPLWINFVNLALYASVAISLIFSCINLIRLRKKIEPAIHVIFAASIVTLLVWIINGPDARFVHGVLTGIVVLGLSTPFWAKDVKIPLPGKITIVGFLLITSFWSFWRIHDRHKLVNERRLEIADKKETRPPMNSLYRPYPYFVYLDAINNLDMSHHFTPTPINNGITMLISACNVTYGQLPATSKFGYAGRQCDYRYLEARGYKLQDGFRMSKTKLRE